METPLIFFLGFIVTFFAFMWGRKWALKFRFVDRAGGRKQHQGAVPLIGGLVVVPMFMMLYVLTSGLENISLTLCAGLFIIVAMGIADDRFNMRAGHKFLIQILVATLIVVGGDHVIRSFGPLWGQGDVLLGTLAIPFTITCVVMVMNAVNMMDGLDGLAGGVSFVILSFLAVLAYQSGQSFYLIVSLMVPLSVFLFFNMRHPWREKAAVFLGDSGSLSLGLILAWMCIHVSQGTGHDAPPVSMLWLLSIPVIDALMLFFLRLTKGRHPFAADRNHLHHRFLDRGVSVKATTCYVMIAACGCGGMALLPYFGVHPSIVFWAWCGGSAIFMGYSLRPSAHRVFETDIK